ncbi:MAG: hypothetical protein ABIO35_03400 [Nitrobacter sp.]
MPTRPGYPGALGLSPGRPLGEAPVPMWPGEDVLGAPGTLLPPVLRPVPVVVPAVPFKPVPVAVLEELPGAD